jgi:TatD DNase family protein
MIEWLDAHTHLDSEDLYTARHDVLKRAVEAGVTQILTVNSKADEESFERTLSCGKETNEVQVSAALGVHPHEASCYDEGLENKLRGYLNERRIIAFGEIGLDFYYNFSPQEVQQSVFLRQLELALEFDLPVIIHCRDAYDLLTDLLKRRSAKWQGMIHCFTGNSRQVEKLLDLGFLISFSGIVTFPKAEELRNAARIVPSDRILIETDAPYLAPVPKRGKKNEPAFVVYTAEFLTNLRKISPEEFSRQLKANFSSLFLS